MMNITYFELEEWEEHLLRRLFPDQDMYTVQESLNADNVAAYLKTEVISCSVYSNLTAPILDQMTDLKLIATRSTGTDHIDFDYCRDRGIAVANVPTYGEHTVAEHVFALLLALSRHIPQAAQRTREGDFSFADFCGFDLHGKTLGLLGTGMIGQRVAQIAHGFGMNVLGYDTDTDAAGDFLKVDFHKLLFDSDIISLHVPSTPETRNLLSDAEFKMMKDGVIIINTARGSIIDINALLRGLNSGKVAAAGLDVLPEEIALHEGAKLLDGSFARQHNLETVIADYTLLHHKNVIITPHSAFYTKEAVERILKTTGDNILSFMKGSARNIVNCA
ncbi:MAG: Hydroxyacid dehydrogenase [Micavibrio sp.]|nr:Hydroxyacid dehydrogenase [Micavibrio sp.]